MKTFSSLSKRAKEHVARIARGTNIKPEEMLDYIKHFFPSSYEKIVRMR